MITDMEIFILVLLVIAIVLLILVLMSLSKQKGIDDSKILNETISETKLLSSHLKSLQEAVRDEFHNTRREASESSRDSREELSKSLVDFRSQMSEYINTGTNVQRQRLSEFTLQIEKLTEISEKKLSTLTESVTTGLEKSRDTLELKLTGIETKNTEKLEQMREIVDKKLQETLDQQITKSFQNVNDNLERVQKGLGEMQNMASEVGDLKKVLSNVKTKGIFGEYTLQNILEEIMTSDQYGQNVQTNPEKRSFVEFAIKLPGKSDGKHVWLPIDSKFPTEHYVRLNDAYEAADKDQVDICKKQLVLSLKSFAKDISEKYIQPPYTTDFAVMFLPVEGLYAEALRDSSLFETLQRDYKIMIAGPSTLAALLNSLNMGFRTLAIEQRSAEVWNILQTVKKEFNEYSKSLEQVNKKIGAAGKEIETLITTRTNAMQRKLALIDDNSDENELAIEQDNLL